MIERLEKMEREIDELKKEIKANEKGWPDSFEEAQRQSEYWGLYAEGSRYLICMGYPANELAVSATGTWATKENMPKYWEGNGDCDGNEYAFHKFDSAKELYLWMAEGE